MTKNIFIYIGIILLGFILRVIAFLYTIVFFFRRRVVRYCNKRFYNTPDKVFEMKHKYKKWKLYIHPYFWFFCLTCNGLDRTYSGSTEFMREQKEKWFPNYLTDLDYNYKYFNLKAKIRYFWICFRWNAIRNPHWAFNEWFFREGEYRKDSVVITKSDAPYGLAELIMPELKWDEGNDMGKQLRYFYEANGPDDEWRTTHEGKKIMWFTTHKENKRFYYGYCKIKPLYKIKRLLAIEQLFGWNWWNGIPVLHNKYIFLKMNETSLAKYNKYIDLLKEIKN